MSIIYKAHAKFLFDNRVFLGYTFFGNAYDQKIFFVL